MFGAYNFLEFISISVLSSQTTKIYQKRFSNSNMVFIVFMFETLQFFYQLGVYISRSSILCFKIRRLWVGKRDGFARRSVKPFPSGE